MSRLKRLLFILLPVTLLVVAYMQRYAIFDWSRLRNYQPPTNVVTLSDQTTMTPYGRKLFYVNHPQLDDKTAFNQSCTISEQTIVLGCYIGAKGIYLFNVDDRRLDGVHQVTAAHEMLHAAYDRLSTPERKHIDELTGQVMATITDQRIKDTVAAYQQRDPGVVPNELHSILGTEVKTLPAELEAYYQRYFTDRQVIVKYSEQYEAAFSDRKLKVEAYDQQLQGIRAQIDSLETSLGTQEKDLEAEKDHLDQLAAQNRVAEYNAAVPDFNAAVRSYNADVAKVRSLIDDFNKIVAARNAIASEETELSRAIDSRPQTLQTE